MMPKQNFPAGRLAANTRELDKIDAGTGSEYDSEEERREERLQNLSRGCSIQRHAARQRLRLKSPRALKAGSEGNGAASTIDERHVILKSRSPGKPQLEEWQAAWLAHEARWTALKPDERLNIASIPWPPQETGILAGMKLDDSKNASSPRPNMKSDMEEGPIEKEELVARPPPGRVICWVNFGHWVPTGGIKDVLIGDYDYNYMFVPKWPYCRSHKVERLPPFFAVNEPLPLLLAMILGFQHAAAMVGGIVLGPILISASNTDPDATTITACTALHISPHPCP
ncbi:hypothetical protein WJX84_005671 [Apatococcus fuscideae]|uniref:Uncharacterized protein n=1 Tax=Apatococcus fuscideae TaxID=2026836 RepID=A0AAW1SHQ3_9CHLO